MRSRPRARQLRRIAPRRRAGPLASGGAPAAYGRRPRARSAGSAGRPRRGRAAASSATAAARCELTKCSAAPGAVPVQRDAADVEVNRAAAAALAGSRQASRFRRGQRLVELGVFGARGRQDVPASTTGASSAARNAACIAMLRITPPATFSWASWSKSSRATGVRGGEDAAARCARARPRRGTGTAR